MPKKSTRLALDIEKSVRHSNQLMKEIQVLLRDFFQSHETIDMRYKLHRMLSEVESDHKLIEAKLKQIKTTLKKRKR